LMKRSRNGNEGSDTLGEADARVEEQELSLELINGASFEELARQFPSFGIALQQVRQSQKAASSCRKKKSSFASHVTPEFGRELTRALLHVHWRGLAIPYFPDDHLCPPVPNRYFFVCWIQHDLMPKISNAPNEFFSSPPGPLAQSLFPRTSFVGLDLGTGASAIYALLHVASSPNYRMYATDIDPASVQYATQNVQANAPRISSAIQIHQVHPTLGKGPLLTSVAVAPPGTWFDFVMTNPPFYDNQIARSGRRGDHDEEMKPEWAAPVRAGDQRARTPMTAFEGSYPGGEVGFVTDMFVDSLRMHISVCNTSNCSSSLPAPPGWTGTMCGQKSSWIRLRHIVTTVLGPGHVMVNEFGPGHMTRWFLAWTFASPQMRSPLARTESVPGAPTAQDTRRDFVVDLAATMLPGEATPSAENALSIVWSRTQEYCQSVWKDEIRAASADEVYHNLSLRDAGPRGQRDGNQFWEDDHLLPESVKEVLSSAARLDFSRSSFLPPEGHFVVDLVVNIVSTTTVQIHIDAFAHSTFGRKVVEKVLESFHFEIGRTNRRWRRKLQAKGPRAGPYDDSQNAQSTGMIVDS
jgi:23S rRNA A1618 N6-methylase RlmF